MKKLISLLLCAAMLFALCACGAQTSAPAEETKAWSRDGYYADENDNMLSVTWMEDVDEPGWYVGVMIGELMAGGTLPQEGNSLRGNLSSWEEGAEPIAVTVSEEGEDGLLLEIAGGESYHFKPYDMPEASIVVNINTEGMGNIDWAEGDQAPEIDTEYPYQSAYIGLAEPKVHTFVAWPQAGSVFVKWMKNGEEFSTDPVVTLLLDESADFVAVFEEDPDRQNPVREDGERFETVIILEGMEETVRYEHIINAALGLEMDYDYESFARNSYPEMECFISVWDGPGNPENFLEVTHRAEDAETVAASVRAELSGEYELTESTRELDCAGECLYIEASVVKGTNNMADQLQMVYIIPAPDGCFVAASHCAAEAAEGFARRFNYMINTISAI